MIQQLSINPGQIKNYRCMNLNASGPLNGFPFLSIDQDSYVVGIEVQSGINFDPESGRHCILIGKGCSLADAITFMVDLNHDYNSVSQGEMSFLQGISRPTRIVRKGTIIIQNDVWIGHGATIMAGVTLHNGCVVAADSVITKDVPPYAVVGGNPAKILRWRFDEKTVEGIQKIAWWNWSPALQYSRRNDFTMPVPEFIEKYLPEAETLLEKVNIAPRTCVREQETVLFIPDFSDPHPLYRKVFSQYFAEDYLDRKLLIYLPESDSIPDNIQTLETILQEYRERDCDVVLQTGETWDEHILFQLADYFITTRSRETVYRTCLADLYHVQILYGTDEPLFYL